MAVLTPMMQQYKEIKNAYPDTILFFRVGDFYEMFFEDAKLAARELEITLTSRDGSKDDGIPLAGVPYHAVQNYIARLLEKGYKVAICDQVEDAAQAKGLVRREVTRVITPGTKIEDSFLEEKRNNFLASVSKNIQDNSFGLSMIDISTGELFALQLKEMDQVVDELHSYHPAEIVLDSPAEQDTYLQKHLQRFLPQTSRNLEGEITGLDDACAYLNTIFPDDLVQSSGILNYASAACATATALKYISKMQKFGIDHVNRLQVLDRNDSLKLDAITVRNLEISETFRTREKKRSLLGLLDQTRTAMGGRLLKKWIEKPLLCSLEIQKRWDAVEELKNNLFMRGQLADLLKNCYDLERLSGRISMGQVNPRDFLALKGTLQLLPEVKQSLTEFSSEKINEINADIPGFAELIELLQQSIAEDAPFTLREGNIFKDGYNTEIDELREITRNSKQWILQLEKEERERTGIKSLKVGYNKVFGYYIEVTKSNVHLVPENYIRKQTLVNAERFITEHLKEKEILILNAEEKLGQLEYELFEEVRQLSARYTFSLQKAARNLAFLDCLYSLAEVASAYGFVKPEIVHSAAQTVIREARHPVVEATQEVPFVPNDFVPEEKRIMVLTGPNMAGKSTYCRSIALLFILAQAGSFVPAATMKFEPVEQIFARVGASDDLSSGRSTFMVEMEETGSILSQAGAKSLVILDEIGRGTSTYDGMSLAQSVLEFLHHETGATVLFSTHYHELTVLEEELTAVKNYCVSVQEKGDEIIFLHKVVPGKADKSYGINVAKLAGLPEKVIDRAQEILSRMESDNNQDPTISLVPGQEMSGQLSLVKEPGIDNSRSQKENKIIQELKKLNLVNMTPLEAINTLFTMQSRLSSRHQSSGEKER